MSIVAIAQQLTPEVEHLRTSLVEAKHLLGQVKQQRESLYLLYAELQDSAAFKITLDSLQQSVAVSPELKQDSLILAFASYQVKLRKLNAAERCLQENITHITGALLRKMLPEEATQALQELKQTELSARSLMPDEHFLNELPAPRETSGMARATYLTGYEDKLTQSRRELEKYKGRFDKMESVKDMPKGFLKLNPLKGKPWPERVALGTLWQFGNQERYLVDLGPYAAWRFTDKLSSGAGFQYRLSVSVKERPWVSGSDRVLGYFAFTNMEVYKGFFGRLHYENLSTPVPRLGAAGQAEGVEQEWVKGLSVGAGRYYTFYKQIKGYSLIQYNLMHRANETPYQQPLQAKIGFYINGKHLFKRKK